MSDSIELTDPQDRDFALIAQNALFNETIMPSGMVTPARDMRIVGTKLGPTTRAEWQAINDARDAKRAEEGRNG